LDIDAFLIKPLQRICRYPLLLKEVLKNTHSKHSDREDLKKALVKVESVVKEVNEAKRLAENLSQIVEIQNNFNWGNTNIELVTPTRRLVKEGQVKKVNKSSLTTGTKMVTFFLFNDTLLIGKPSLTLVGNKCTYKDLIPIDKVIVWDVKEEGKIKNAFTIVRTDKKDKTSYSCSTKEEKEQWVNCINEGIINVPMMMIDKDKKDTKALREAAFLAFKKTMVQ